MKTVVLILSIVCVVLCGMLYLSSSSRKALQAHTSKQLVNLTNEIKRVETESFKTIGDLTVTNSLLQSNLTVTVRQCQSFSNRLARTENQLAATRTARQAAENEAAQLRARIEQLQAEMGGLQQRMVTLTPVASELQETRDKLAAAEQQIRSLRQELGTLQVAYNQTQRQLEDPEFLEHQLAKAKKLAKLKAAEERRTRKERPNLDAPLILLPDGSVALAPLKPAEKQPQ